MLLSQAQRTPGSAAPNELALQLHLFLCKGCRNFRAQLEFLRSAVRRYRDAEDAL